MRASVCALSGMHNNRVSTVNGNSKVKKYNKTVMREEVFWQGSCGGIVPVQVQVSMKTNENHVWT